MARAGEDPPALVLKAGREKSLLRRHPWVFSGAIERADAHTQTGDTVAVRTSAGAFLAWAAYSPQSQIRARVWSWAERERIDGRFFVERVRAAIARRAGLASAATRAPAHSRRSRRAARRRVRPVRRGRRLPVLVGRRRALARGRRGRGARRRRLPCRLRAVRSRRARAGGAGAALGAAPRRACTAATVGIVEHGLKYGVDVAHGQKTGFYLDQRANRDRVRALAGGRDVLNCFCYTGGFTLNALAGGARSALSIDSSAAALALARENAALNGLDDGRAEWLEADVFAALRTLRDQGRSFDLVVLDPPKFAPTAGHAEKAARAYKDINLLALKLLRPCGVLVTFSCSGGVSPELFQKIVAGAAADAEADVALLERLHADADHPVTLAFPEGEYLKGLVLEKR